MICLLSLWWLALWSVASAENKLWRNSEIACFVLRRSNHLCGLDRGIVGAVETWVENLCGWVWSVVWKVINLAMMLGLVERTKWDQNMFTAKNTNAPKQSRGGRGEGSISINDKEKKWSWRWIYPSSEGKEGDASGVEQQEKKRRHEKTKEIAPFPVGFFFLFIYFFPFVLELQRIPLVIVALLPAAGIFLFILFFPLFFPSLLRCACFLGCSQSSMLYQQGDIYLCEMQVKR